MLSSGNNLGRGSTQLPSDMPPLPQCLPLDPITLSNQKSRSGELSRVLGVPLRSTSEDHSFGVGHLKPPPPVASEDLKHFKESVQDTSKMARERVKKLRTSIFKLDKYTEALNSKKRQRSDVSSVERSGGGNFGKIGGQIPRTPPDILTQRLEDRAKSVGLNKRVRTSLADVRADNRSPSALRQQIVTEKDGDMIPAVNSGSTAIEEKIRKLPAGSEGWDAKMKKKRSIGSVGNRVAHGDRHMKRATHPKLSADSKLRSCDALGFRAKTSAESSRMNKLDSSFEAASSDAGMALRKDLESPALPKDRSSVFEQRFMAKGSNKPLIHEDNLASSSNAMLKGKVSRAPRTGSMMVLDSSSKVHSSSGASPAWEQATSLVKVPISGVANHQKCSMSTGSSWVGQRPHKNSRTRRVNLVSPVSDNVESHISSQGFASSDFCARASFGTTRSPLPIGVDNVPKFKREPEVVSSPLGLSESEESGGGEIRLKEKERGINSGEATISEAHKVRAFVFPSRKNKIPANDLGDGMRRQGRNGSSSVLTRPGIHSLKEKSENLPKTKPLQIMRPTSDKNKCKSGRPPSKKMKDRKVVTRIGPVLNSSSPDLTGESDDDQEDLHAAASSARNASSQACSGPFWKQMESIFASVGSEDISYLKQQLSSAEELEESLSLMFGDNNNVSAIADLSGKGQGSLSNKESLKSDALCGSFDVGRLGKVTPLYQRVLSALIEDDESEEYYNHSEGKNISFHYASDDSHCGSCNHIDIEIKDRDRMESEVESREDFLSQQTSLLDRLSCEKSAASNTYRKSSISNSLHSTERWLGDDDFSHSDVGVVSEICSNDVGRLQHRESNISSLSSSDDQYQLMGMDERILLELQSIGLYPESLPDLAEGEDLLNEDILELKKRLYQQIKKKKERLGKVDKAIQKGRVEERRSMEYVAMDQLIEIAYRKRMACRGSNASKSAVRKVSKQNALRFINRTLARCQSFEDTGGSCFREPALQDVMFSAPPCSNADKSGGCVGSGTASNTCNETSNIQVRGSGAVSSTFERFDSHSDNNERASSDALPSEHALSKKEAVLNKGKKREALIDDVVGSASSKVTSTFDGPVLGGARAKRSERDNARSNSVSGAGRLTSDSSKDERRTKTKPKQKNSGNGPNGRFSQIMQPVGQPGSDRVKTGKKSDSVFPDNGAGDASKEADDPNDFVDLEPEDFDAIDETQDLNSWFNLDGLQDHDSMGLEIPMDDLSSLNMLI